MAPKLTYFDARWLAEISRLLFSYGNIEFEDVRIVHGDQEAWKAFKPKTPFGQLPILEDNGKVAWQSTAIARYAATLVGLMGANPWENLEIDSIVDTASDLRTKIGQYYYESDKTKQETMKKTCLEETVPFYLEKLDKIAMENNGHMVAKKLTWADFAIFVLLDQIAIVYNHEVYQKYKHLVAVKNNIENIPNIKKWIEKRPAADY